jgi:hypothetical protein
MRRDKQLPWQVYEDFWQWLRLHPIWLLAIFWAYPYYITSTEEV